MSTVHRSRVVLRRNPFEAAVRSNATAFEQTSSVGESTSMFLVGQVGMLPIVLVRCAPAKKKKSFLGGDPWRLVRREHSAVTRWRDGWLLVVWLHRMRKFSDDLATYL